MFRIPTIAPQKETAPIGSMRHMAAPLDHRVSNYVESKLAKAVVPHHVPPLLQLNQLTPSETNKKCTRIFGHTLMPRALRNIFGLASEKKEMLSVNDVNKLQTEMANRHRALSQDVKASYLRNGLTPEVVLDEQPPAGQLRSPEELEQALDAAKTSIDSLVNNGALPNNELANASFSSLPKPGASVTRADGKAAENLIQKTHVTFNHQVDKIETMIREYLNEIEERNKLMSKLDELKQRLRTSGDNIEWKNDPALVELLGLAAKLGVQIPEGDIWTEKEIAILKENIDGVMDNLMHGNDSRNLRLTMYLNAYKIVLELYSDALKIFVNIIEHCNRNLLVH